MMEFNFDNEINALLRNEARNVKTVSGANVSHLDADEISAFAENVLPVKAQIRATEHLANCDNCRVSLSNLIVLNSEIPDDAPAKIVEKKIAAAAVPWYRKIFAAPNLAYGLGALLLVFSGLVAFVAVQNYTSSDTQLSQMNEQVFNSNSNTISRKQVSAETDSAADANMANLNSNAVIADSLETPLTENSNDLRKETPNAPEPARKNQAENNLESARQNEVTTAKPRSSPSVEDADLSGVSMTATDAKEARTAESEEREKAVAEDKADSNYAAPSPSQSKNPQTLSRKGSPAANQASERAKRSESTERKTSVGGKNFKRENNVWIDIDYKDQKTTKITRGTNEYKKLDKDLRVIVENLGGIVIIVWKEKAYRIQ